jgi:tetratricopeptide (TPR) repeat protein
LHRNEDAIEQYRGLLKVAPTNREAVVGVAQLLIADRKYADAVQLLEKAAALSPDSPSLQSLLGFCYLKNQQPEQGKASLQKSLTLDPRVTNVGQVAYVMADANVDLEQAMAYGKQALHQAETESLTGGTDEVGLTNTLFLARSWDTIGWIYFRLGQYDQALPYLRSSWLLSQRAVVGDHLAQTYEMLGKKQEAIHTYRLALAAEGTGKDDLRKHYEALSGQKADDADAPLLRRGANGTSLPSPGEELSRMRTAALTTRPHDSASAVFTIVFSPDKIEDVKYVSGGETLRTLATRMGAAKFKVEFPNSDPVRLTRRALAACNKFSGCDVVLLLPDSVHAVDSGTSQN